VRSGRNKEALAKCIGENVDVDFGVIRAACLRLKSSDLTSRGPIYATLKEHCP
jgi:2'-5' RNA ligase